MLLITCLSLLLVMGKCADSKPELTWEAKLDKYLTSICPDTRQMAPKHRTNVTVKFMLKSFFFDAGEEVFSMYSWVFLKWNDHRLTWDPKDYDDIEKLQISSTNIWNPMDNFKNLRSKDELDYLWTLICDILSTGDIICVPRTIFEVVCTSKLSDWPYDTQTCRFEFQFVGNTQLPRAVFRFGEGRAVSMLGAEYGGTWNIVDYKQGEQEDLLYFELTIERQALGLGTMLTAPAIALMLLTISLMLLDVHGSTRIALACFSVLSHFILLEVINYSIPQHGRETPTILIYTRTSLVITSLTLVFSLILTSMSKSSKVPSPWITGINTWVQNTPLRYVVQSSSLPDTVSDSLIRIHYNEWMDFISLVNNLVLVIVAVSYIIVYMKYIPSPPSLV